MSCVTCPEWKTFPSSSTYSEVIMAQLDLEKEDNIFSQTIINFGTKRN